MQSFLVQISNCGRRNVSTMLKVKNIQELYYHQRVMCSKCHLWPSAASFCMLALNQSFFCFLCLLSFLSCYVLLDNLAHLGFSFCSSLPIPMFVFCAWPQYLGDLSEPPRAFKKGGSVYLVVFSLHHFYCLLPVSFLFIPKHFSFFPSFCISSVYQFFFSFLCVWFNLHVSWLERAAGYKTEKLRTPHGLW